MQIENALLIKVNQFYKEIDETQINIKAVAVDGIKKAIKQIAKAIGDITRVLDEDDPLTILMVFSGDPVYLSSYLSITLFDLWR